MQCIEKTYTADGLISFIVEGTKAGLIGYDYKFIHPMKAMTVRDCYCETDMHYYERKAKNPIPANTEVMINSYWMNFYGSYFKVAYDGKIYDINPKYLKILRNNDSTRD